MIKIKKRFKRFNAICDDVVEKSYHIMNLTSYLEDGAIEVNGMDIPVKKSAVKKLIEKEVKEMEKLYPSLLKAAKRLTKKINTVTVTAETMTQGTKGKKLVEFDVELSMYSAFAIPNTLKHLSEKVSDTRRSLITNECETVLELMDEMMSVELVLVEGKISIGRLEIPLSVEMRSDLIGRKSSLENKLIASAVKIEKNISPIIKIKNNKNGKK